MSTILPRSDLGAGLCAHCTGDGPPLLLIHGVGMRAEFWQSLVPELSSRFSLTVIDLPGHGDSEALNSHPLHVSTYSDRLADSVALSGSPSIVVGHSLGALIALDLAARHSDCVSGLGVINGIYRRDTAATEKVRARAAQLDQRTNPDTRPDNGPTLARWFGDTPQGVDLQASEACDHWLATADPIGYRDAYRVFADSDAPDDALLERISVPALVATGSHDMNSSASMARDMAALIPDAHSLIVEGARHMMPMTHTNALRDALLHRFVGERVPHG